MNTRLIRNCALFVGALLTTTMTAFAQVDQDNPGTWLPYSASTYSDEVDKLYRWIFYLTTGMFILTEGLLILFCILYRRRPGHRPTYTHGSSKAELTWTIIPALMLLGLAIIQIPAWNDIKKPDWAAKKAEPNTTVIDVIGEQYKWQIRYPGTKAKYKAEDEVTNTSLVHIPFGDQAYINLRSKDVIHSLFIPHMRVKQDAVPGLRQQVWFKPNRIFLLDLDKSKDFVDGKYYELDKTTNDWAKKDRTVQRKHWVSDPKAFLPGGDLYDQRIAVSVQTDYSETNGYFKPYEFKNPDGTVTVKKVVVLHQGKVAPGEWSSCRYALGSFEIACAELCGMAHYTMRAFLIVSPKAFYDSWIADEAENAGPPQGTNAWKFWVD